MDAEKDKKKRGKRFSNSEDIAVLKGARKQGEIINTPTNKNSVLKRQAWQEICDEVNAVTKRENNHIKRTVNVVKKRYKDIRRAAKKRAVNVMDYVISEKLKPNRRAKPKQSTEEAPAAFPVETELGFVENGYNGMNVDTYKCSDSSSNNQLQMPTVGNDSTLERMLVVQEQMVITLQEIVVEFRRDVEQRRQEAASVLNILKGIRDGLLTMATNVSRS